MIKFFRRIRRKLLTDNKFSKYLIYAIGEIILVVIGILIALSINNWNEKRIQIKQENEIIISLIEELKTNISQLKKSIDTNNKKNLQTESLLILLKDSSINTFNEYEVVSGTSYSPFPINATVLQEILKSDNKLVRRKKEIINDLRGLNTSLSDIEKALFYVDEMYNQRAADFTIKLGLAYNKEESINRNITLENLKENGYTRRQLISLLDLLNNLRKDWVESQIDMLDKSQILLEKLVYD